MRVAFIGKGGAGKSSVCGTFARLLGTRGEPVLVLDSDPMPGLALTLGIEPTDDGIPDEATRPGPPDGPRFVLREGLDAAEAVERYALRCPDGVRLLQLGKLRDHISTQARSLFAFRQIVGELASADGRWHLVGDLPAGTRQPYFGWGRYADTLLVVVEPTATSLLSARRLAGLADAEAGPRLLAVANKVADRDDVCAVVEHTGLEVAAVVPWDEALVEADRCGRPLVEHAPESAATRAITRLVERLASDG